MENGKELKNKEEKEACEKRPDYFLINKCENCGCVSEKRFFDLLNRKWLCKSCYHKKNA
jgi:formylmethanofuran dehydrogenase subunit E